MALSYKARKRWSLLVLVVGLPLYIMVAVSLVSLLPRPSMVLELVIYIGLGIVWVLPLKSLFRGVGQPDPEAQARTSELVDDLELEGTLNDGDDDAQR